MQCYTGHTKFVKMKTKLFVVGIIYCVANFVLVKAGQKQYEDLNGYYKTQTNLDEYEDFAVEDAEDCREAKDLPVIVWWTPFTGVLGLPRHCDLGNCCLTQDRRQIHRSDTKVILFYGTDFNPIDLPLPRRKDIWWGLLHEESPKNKPILNHFPVLRSFNLTGTFKWESDFPLTLQFLPSVDLLTSRKEFVPTKKKNEFLRYSFALENNEESQHVKSREVAANSESLEEVKLQEEESFTKVAPVVYIHSDCDTPSERDRYVTELSKYIKIDSLGDCLNSRTLPPHIEDASHFNHPDFLRLLAKYKFTLSIENYGCDGYITEKFWRPLIVGSVPVYWGSPGISDWAPNPESLIKISDFESPKHLAEYLHSLLKNDTLYESHLTHKINGEISNLKLLSAMNDRQWGVDDLERGSFIDHFECFVCDEMYRNHPHFSAKTNYEYESKTADSSHCNCPQPNTVLTNKVNQKSHWLEEYEKSKTEAKVLGIFLRNNEPFSEDDFYTKVFKNLRKSGFFHKFPPRHDEL